MKKILAATLALIMTATVMASCGSDDSSSKADSKAAATEASSAAAEESSKADESSATESSSAASSTAESAAQAEGPKATSEIPNALANQETASLTFTTDMKVEDFLTPLGGNNYTDDESQVKLSIEELEGIPMVRVQVLDKDEKGDYKIPKIHFDMSKLFANQTADLPKIFTVKADIITKAVGEFHDDQTGDDKMVPGNFLGSFGTQAADANGNIGWEGLIEFKESEWTSEWGYSELTIRPGIKETASFKDTTTPQYLFIMRWGMPNQADFYIANLTFLDEENNVIPCNYGKNS